MTIEIHASEAGMVGCKPAKRSICVTWQRPQYAKMMILADVKDFLPNAHIEIKSVTVSER